jgi:hypothetical protein
VALDSPVLRKKSASRGSSLDFAFVYRKNVYAVTLCCDPLRHGTLSEAGQVAAENNTKAFDEFLDAARNPAQYQVISGSDEIPAAGSILVWQRVDDRRTLHSALRKQYNFQALLSLETMLGELASWHNRDFQLLLDQRFAWCHDLFKALRAIR